MFVMMCVDFLGLKLPNSPWLFKCALDMIRLDFDWTFSISDFKKYRSHIRDMHLKNLKWVGMVEGEGGIVKTWCLHFPR